LAERWDVPLPGLGDSVGVIRKPCTIQEKIKYDMITG
jgi:hypothetical protein